MIDSTDSMALETVTDYCPSWCADEKDQVELGLYLPRYAADWHESAPTGTDGPDGGSAFFVHLKKRDLNGMTIAETRGLHGTVIEVSDGLGERGTRLTLSSADARALAAHLIHHADVAEGLRR